MKCIYCNKEHDLTVSDIIPAALTGAKLRKRFVCHTHNAFTNDNYEKIMIRQLDIFRNRIGLTERDGDPIRFNATLSIGDYTAENVSISDNRSIMDSSNRLFRMKDADGHKVLVGEKSKLMRIKGATEDKISDLPLADISISSKADLRELFISEPVLHAIAKIAYEWHCYINDVEEFDGDIYGSITSYILNPEEPNTLIELVTDTHVMTLSDQFSRTGTNMLFEYQDAHSDTYVIFSLWNVIIYKVKICHNTGMMTPKTQCPTAYFYHADGTQNGSLFAVMGNFHVYSEKPHAGLSILAAEIKSRMNRLGERDLSREYLTNGIANISKHLSSYRAGKITLAELLDFEHEDRVIPVYILELMYEHKDEYIATDDFYRNMQRILKTNDRFVFSVEETKRVLQRYLDMDKKGTFISMIDAAIDFFNTTCVSKTK